MLAAILIGACITIAHRQHQDPISICVHCVISVEQRRSDSTVKSSKTASFVVQ